MLSVLWKSAKVIARKDCSRRKKKHDDEPACHLHTDDMLFLFIYLFQRKQDK